MQRDASAEHVAKQMKHEALLYKKLAGNPATEEAVARYYGYSENLGVSVLCLSKEGPTFEEIGLDNLSDELKASALDCLRQLGMAGILHNDVTSPNSFAQSKSDPNKAKIVKLRKATFCQDRDLLNEEVERLAYILGL
eukprot:CAMPEP_0116552246 /NCGR_PEP_ID=MMETSP0397-20121206/6384_1 /TAXON_ID=216820 /ORGANISM="Cyclophora tenuis, Strain ECT3854" /LENGTH=137 /DNA_ID=CAMNT_0004077183 /DNA_START=68 /DNA_END=481 /DNA_ORIENTATION=+